MTNLISTLEKAETGSRELDALIARHLGWVSARHTDGGAAEIRFLLQHGHVPAQEAIGDRIALPRYTTSVDAALTLIPAGMDWGVRFDVEAVHGGICAYVWTDHPTHKDTFCSSEPCQTRHEAQSHLPRLICIAALRAREGGK